MLHPDNAAALAPAISALRLELADLERRAAETRSLIEGLCAHAGIADEPAAAPGEAAVPSSAAIKGERNTGKLARCARGKGRRIKNAVSLENRISTLAAAEPDLTASISDWQKVLASRDKDQVRLAAAVARRRQLELAAGKILTAIDGRVRPLPGETDRSERERWKQLAQLPAADFDNQLRRAQRRALQQIGVAPEKPAPAKAKPSARPQQAMKISDWREEPDGSRSRTVTAVDGVAPRSTAAA
jgi:hypothetical protein